MEEALSNLTEAMKEFAYRFMEKAKEVFEKFTRRIEEYFNSIDHDKYIKYKKYQKYQKRVKNRKILYAKRKAKYGR
ncbi:MAG: Transposase [uncultured Clostridium sp.]